MSSVRVEPGEIALTTDAVGGELDGEDFGDGREGPDFRSRVGAVVEVRRWPPRSRRR